MDKAVLFGIYLTASKFKTQILFTQEYNNHDPLQKVLTPMGVYADGLGFWRNDEFDPDDDIRYMWDGEDGYGLRMDDCQLILRTLDDLTDEEQRQALEIGEYSTEVYTFRAVAGSKNHKVIDYLRSIGIDVDNLIKQGFAVRKEADR